MSGPGRRRDGAEGELARVYREFADGLTGRLARIRAGVDELREGWSPEAARGLRRETHTLKGTAASFGAAGIAEVAAELTELVAGWLEAGATDPEELARGSEEVDRLERRIEEYRARSAGREV